MIRSALLLCAGVIFVASVACAPASSPPPPPPVAPHGLANCDVNKPNNFPLAVTMLAPGFVPGNLQAPAPPNPPLALTPQMQTDLIAAFTAAPPIFRKALCKLDGIYIDPSAPSSWGFRDPNSHARYIGLAANLWGSNGNSPVSVYSDYENSVLDQVMTQYNMPWPAPSGTVPYAPEYESPVSGTSGFDVDTSATTLVAMLAHEFGHILWYDKVKGGDPNYKPNNFCSASGNNFFTGSWQGTVNQPKTFVEFAKQSQNTPEPGTGSIAALQAAIQAGQLGTAASDLNTIYTTVWPSLLGAVSPEEDFAETVKMFVLTLPGANQSHPITSMPLDIYTVPQLENPTYKPDVYAGWSGVRRTVLVKKVRCITNSSP